MDPIRLQRVAETMREELEELIGYELTDPRLAAVAVADVHMSPDSRHARIAVNVAGGEEERRAALDALEHARHYIRRQLAARLELFRMPDLHFEAAAVVDERRIGSIIKRIRKGRPREEGPADEK
jgi:ribosome-binding factor A